MPNEIKEAARTSAPAGGRAAREPDGNAWHDVPSFVLEATFDTLPADVAAQAQRCLLDLIGVACAGSRTPAAAIVNAYASTQLCGRDHDAAILLDGRRSGVAGAAF